MSDQKDSQKRLRKSVTEDCSTDEYSTTQDQEDTLTQRAPHSNRQGKKWIKCEDSNGDFLRHIANKLRNVQPEQMRFVHKLIGDVLFEAEMESLNKYFKLIDETPRFLPPPPPPNYYKRY